MVTGENADFVTADLLPNRTGSVQVEPRVGLWKARFGLQPVKGKESNTPEFKSALAECTRVGKTQDTENRARGNMASIQSKRAECYPDWVKQPEAEKPHLSRDDGR